MQRSSLRIFLILLAENWRNIYGSQANGIWNKLTLQTLANFEQLGTFIYFKLEQRVEYNSMLWDLVLDLLKGKQKELLSKNCFQQTAVYSYPGKVTSKNTW